MEDVSAGWNAVATQFIARRSPHIGVATVRAWSADLAPAACILDLGCGHGVPIAVALSRDGFAVSGIDASETLISEFQRQLPGAPVRCEGVQTSTFFNRRFDAAIAIGLLFLLDEPTQRQLIHRVAGVLTPGGRFLFTAPAEAVVWTDSLTGRPSRSLGRKAYGALLREAGLELAAESDDEGDNHYYSTTKPLPRAAAPERAAPCDASEGKAPGEDPSAA